jgi:hypothetical protein
MNGQLPSRLSLVSRREYQIYPSRTCDSSRDHDVTMLDISDDGQDVTRSHQELRRTHRTCFASRGGCRNSMRELDDDQRTYASHGCRYQGFFISMRDPSVKCQGDTKNEKE